MDYISERVCETTLFNEIFNEMFNMTVSNVDTGDDDLIENNLRVLRCDIQSATLLIRDNNVGSFAQMMPLTHNLLKDYDDIGLHLFNKILVLTILYTYNYVITLLRLGNSYSQIENFIERHHLCKYIFFTLFVNILSHDYNIDTNLILSDFNNIIN